MEVDDGPHSEFACATLITTPGYVIGGVVLGQSLRRTAWPHDSVALVTPNIDESDRARLKRTWDRVVEVEPIDNPNPPADRGLATFATVYTKLRVWEQTNYRKVVFVDADAIVLGDLTELLERPSFAAAPCMTAPDQFNSGAMVVEPSKKIFDDMMEKRGSLSSYDGSDQGFLNSYFDDWFAGPSERRLPFVYNVPRLLAFYASSWKHYLPQIKVLHFYGPRKPWQSKGGMFSRKLLRTVIGKLTSLKMAEPLPGELWREIFAETEEAREQK